MFRIMAFLLMTISPAIASAFYHPVLGTFGPQQVWGLKYIDELVQQTNNRNPSTNNDCLETTDKQYWAMCDASYNVLGVADKTGLLVERYEYTPYGERKVFFSAGTSDPGCYNPTLVSQRVVISSTAQPWGLCEFGHQGLLHDEETGLLYNRARMLHPVLGRFMQRDPFGYLDGMSLYEYLQCSPGLSVDPRGLCATSQPGDPCPAHKYVFESVGRTWIDPNVVMANMKFVQGKTHKQLAALSAIATASELVGDNGTSDAQDGKYRLFSRFKLYFNCKCDKIQERSIRAEYIAASGSEAGIKVGSAFDIQTTKFSDDKSSIDFDYRVKGKPLDIAEVGFQQVQARTSMFIWHRVTGNVDCKDGKGRHTASLSGSGFPMHTLFIHGRKAKVIGSQDLSLLWIADPTNATLVAP
jgi:RHS repeat-associated protein